MSVGRTGSRQDNAVAKSLFAALKNEIYLLRSWAMRSEAKAAVIEFIEPCYIRSLPHSTIGYKIEDQIMDEFFERTNPEVAEIIE